MTGLLLLALLALTGCASRAAETPRPAGPLAVAESLYLDLRDVRDRIDVAAAAARNVASDGTPVSALAARHHELRRAVIERIAAVDSAQLSAEDRRAFGVMRRALARELTPVSTAAAAAVAEGRPDCGYDPGAIARADSLRARIYACYAWAQSHVVVDDDTLDRLTVYSELARTESRERRRLLFLALDPVWRSINRDDFAASPYRTLIALDAPPARPASRRARRRPRRRAFGLPRALASRCSGGLASGRAGFGDRALGLVLSRRPAHPRARKPGAEGAARRDQPGRLPGPGRRPRRAERALRPGAARRQDAGRVLHLRREAAPGRRTLDPGEPSVFATYRTGGLDNLAELLHETGHAIHIAAIHTRPAFTDWPDSDPFTEAVADFVALDVAEPAWQQRWLGDSVPLADGLRARYGGIVLDVAWSLFELRMLRDPSADPNEVWTRLTSEYLRIRPHPKVSWWAMRGQLVDAPGYMMNYAIGAMLIAALRARTLERHGPWIQGDTSWYPWVSRALFRYGLERPNP